MLYPLTISPLGFWHLHAEQHARQIQEHPASQLGPVWDDDPERGAAAAARLGVPFEPDLARLLARPDIAGVTVTNRTSDRSRVITAAIDAGKHVFAEKPLAPTVAEAGLLVAAAHAADVRLTVALPKLSEATTVAAKRLLALGMLGELSYARVRMAHSGWLGDRPNESLAESSDDLNGALSELGCHPLYLVQLFLGPRPVSVTASFGRLTEGAVEDNAVVTMEYENGAIGVAEASFVTTPASFTFELRGTEGSLIYGYGGGRLLARGPRISPDSWAELPLPTAGPTPFEQWIDDIRDGRDGSAARENQSAAIELTRLLTAAKAAARRS